MQPLALMDLAMSHVLVMCWLWIFVPEAGFCTGGLGALIAVVQGKKSTVYS